MDLTQYDLLGGLARDRITWALDTADKLALVSEARLRRRAQYDRVAAPKEGIVMAISPKPQAADDRTVPAASGAGRRKRRASEDPAYRFALQVIGEYRLRELARRRAAEGRRPNGQPARRSRRDPLAETA